MLRNLLIGTIATLMLTGCISANARYSKPEVAVPASFRVETEQLTAAPATNEAAWWTRFEDEVLTQLIEKALGSNHDIREAVTRIDSARAIRAQATHSLFPAGGVSASHLEAKGDTTIASGGVDVGWEVDLFGRVRSQRRAAQADFERSEALLAQTKLIVAAEVAKTYYELRASELRLSLLQNYREDQAALVELVKIRVEEGVAIESDLSRAASTLAEDDSAIARERHRWQVLTNALAVLVGEQPGHWAPAAAELSGKVSMQRIEIGNPSQLLRQRPDIRAAERALAAETAEIGVATASLFPQISLGGFFGYAAGSFGDMSASNSSWLSGPSVTWPLFDLGRIRARIRQSKAEAEGALVNYERTVLRALEDTQNAFSAFATAQETLGATETQLQNAKRAAELGEIRYEEGVTGYFEYLDARRALVRAELARATTLAEHRTATVDVFRALGTAP